MTIDELAQLIRRVDGNHTLGAGALAEALHPAIPGLEAMADLEAALDKEWAYSAELKQQLAAAREALATLEKGCVNIACGTPCEKHSGDNMPSFEWFAKFSCECFVCTREALQAAEADAARYRWLRDNKDLDGPRITTWDKTIGEPMYPSPTLSDALVDAAMNATLQRDHQP